MKTSKRSATKIIVGLVVCVVFISVFTQIIDFVSPSRKCSSVKMETLSVGSLSNTDDDCYKNVT